MNEFHNATVAGLASFPGRADILEDCIARIAPQVDAVILYLNEFAKVPDFLTKYANVHPILGKDAYGDLSAAGKMAALEHCRDSYLFVLDDDVLVPPDYVSRFKKAIDAYDGRAGFAVHGSVISGDAAGYFERSLYFGWRNSLKEHRLVTLIGSGTFAVHQSCFPATFEQFLGPIMVDLRISLICRDNGVPLLSIARPPRWLGFNIQEGLWEQFRDMVTHHTHVMRESRPWTFPRFAAMVTSMFERYFGGFSRDAAQIRKFDTEVAAAILGGWIPPGWDTTIIGLNTRSRHLRTFGQ
jgi:hypothetical protein